MWDKSAAIKGLLDLFKSKNVIGWFLSSYGLEAENSIARLLTVITVDYQLQTDSGDAELLKLDVLHHDLVEHRLGVELIAPRHEKIHFDGTGLTKHLPTTSSDPPLTPEQRKIWMTAFITFSVRLRCVNVICTFPYINRLTDFGRHEWSSESLWKSTPLFYFANCPLPYESDPMLDTAGALGHCQCLQEGLRLSGKFNSRNKSDLSRAVYHIHTCLAKRVEFVRQSYRTVMTSTFLGTPFDILQVVKVLNDLEKLSKVSALSYLL